MPFMRGTTPPTMEPTAAVLKADASVLADGISADGCIALVGGMWGLVRKDLEHGCPKTRRWLDSDEFDTWCDICHVDAVALHDHLIAAHWKHRAA